jgi:L-lactate dehydrogenase complex protein LldE
MQAALMVPCYIDMFYPHVGIATLELLEKLGVDVVYPKDQTCCGQPMANSGCYEEARATEEHCASIFGSFLIAWSLRPVRLLEFRNKKHKMEIRNA